MVKLRFARFGKKNSPSYRLVAINSTNKRNGEAIQYLGTYDPKTKPSTVVFDNERVKYWLSKGAQPSDTVRNMLEKMGILEKSQHKVYQSKPGKKAKARSGAKEVKPEPVAEVAA
jgi:small subunit ribosomal protein S16